MVGARCALRAAAGPAAGFFGEGFLYLVSLGAWAARTGSAINEKRLHAGRHPQDRRAVAIYADVQPAVHGRACWGACGLAAAQQLRQPDDGGHVPQPSSSAGMMPDPGAAPPGAALPAQAARKRCRIRWTCWASCWAPAWRWTRRITRVSDEMQHIYPELATEFYTVVMQVRAGQERTVAFQQLVRRTGHRGHQVAGGHDRAEREASAPASPRR